MSGCWALLANKVQLSTWVPQQQQGVAPINPTISRRTCVKPSEDCPQGSGLLRWVDVAGDKVVHGGQRHTCRGSTARHISQE